MTPSAVAALRFSALALTISAGALWAWASQQAAWQIHGDSMAPRLPGAHQAWQCDECSYRFLTTIAETAVCPNCGRRGLRVADAKRRAPSAAVVAPRSVFPLRTLRRGDLVAYRGADQRVMVKRVYGLPGETIELRDGDLWVNGARWQKSLEEFRRTAVCVHDSGCLAQPSARWSAQPLREDVWRLAADHASGRGRELHRAVGSPVAYQHRVSFDASRDRSARSPVYDHYAYNANHSRPLARVSDVMVEFQVRWTDGAVIECEASDWRLRLAMASERIQWSLVVHQQTARGSCPAGGQWRRVQVGVLDGRVLLAVDGCEQGHLQWAGRAPEEWQVNFRSTGLASWLRRPIIWRDLQLTPALGGARRWRLNPQQWFVLGDNLPASLDSRMVGPISRSQLLGRVFPR